MKWNPKKTRKTPWGVEKEAGGGFVSSTAGDTTLTNKWPSDGDAWANKKSRGKRFKGGEKAS